MLRIGNLVDALLMLLTFSLVFPLPLGTCAPPPSTYTVTIHVTGLPSGCSASLWVDKVWNGTIAGGGSRSFAFSAFLPVGHSISVAPIIDFGGGSRCYCESHVWDFYSAGSHTFVYVSQFYLWIDTDPKGLPMFVSGEGWYGSGTMATTGTAQSKIDSRTFIEWRVDGMRVQGNPISIAMRAPHRAVAVYQSAAGATYNVTMIAYCFSARSVVSVSFTWDGTTYSTPRTLTGVGNHTVVAASRDPHGHPFTGWYDTGSPSNSRSIFLGGTYQVNYGSGISVPDFDISASPPYQLVSAGGSVKFTITILGVNGFYSSVYLSVSVPSNARGLFDPNVVTATGASELTIKTTSVTPKGPFTLNVTGTSAGKKHSITVTLVVDGVLEDLLEYFRRLGLVPKLILLGILVASAFLITIAAMTVVRKKKKQEAIESRRIGRKVE